jgi:8-oxo-dGTP pyrophosphatase MutT (NUDIX family)
LEYSLTTPPSSQQSHGAEAPLFVVEMNWGQQPVRLTAWVRDTIPSDAPITSVHIVALFGARLLVVRDRKGIYGFPGGRLDPGESREQAMDREVYEEANAYVVPGYTLYGVIKIEYTQRLQGRAYPNEFSYLAMYAGKVKSLDPFNGDPAGIILERALFTRQDCERHLLNHDKILLREGVRAMLRTREDADVRAFLGEAARDTINGHRPAG